MKAFTSIPFFRILIPFVVGILIGLKFDTPHLSFYFTLMLFIPIIFLMVYQSGKRSYKWLFLIFADLFLFLFGMNLCEQNNLGKQTSYYGNQIDTDSLITFMATISDVPTEKEKFVKCRLTVNEVKSNNSFVSVKGTIYGYFRKSKQTNSLQAGKTLLIKAHLQELSPPKNSYEFDYRNYLSNKQIYHTAFIDSNAYTSLNVKSQLNPVWNLGLTCKQLLLMRLKNSELTINARAVCAALITGYDAEIDKSVMEAFSHSGTLHVLSVSGLHTGLIYLALGFLFNFFDKKNKYKLLRFVFITLCLWFFALITGFSAPVLRAVIMFNLLGFGRIYFRANYRHQINILLVSAFLLLLYNPYFIIDVGFLLSYFALFGLLYFQPRFSRLWQPENKSLNYIWQSVTASMAATLSTLPITLFYFKQFPLWFFVCNIVVVPATFLVLILTVFVVFKINVFAILINYLIAGLIWFINLFNSKNIGYIDAIHFSFIDVLFLSIFIIILSIAIQYRSHKQLIFSIIILITWQFFSLIESYTAKTKSLLTVYNLRNKSSVAIKNKTKVQLSKATEADYNFSVKPHITSFNYPQVMTSSFNALVTKNGFILFLNKMNFWPQVDYKKVNTLIVQNNFKLSKEDLSKFKNLRTIIMDASNNNYTLAKTEELSRNFDLEFYNTKYKGAYLLELQ
ncbi:ComEC/Rec2 family competence protein [Aurantibacillus circumpalustris]|uniref:ComEC/Rec2 family competence protein n=1 Tax=Aurantibacillus circumpalustris TaxID=3036359 RepID=UPI00295A62A3|nr:ComEC/Rec2 family competence protein [Aurantibacillus circumpalustris]